MLKYKFLKKSRFCRLKFSKISRWQSPKDYALTLDMTEEFAAVESDQKDRDAKQYFIEYEGIFSLKIQKIAFTTLKTMYTHVLLSR